MNFVSKCTAENLPIPVKTEELVTFLERFKIKSVAGDRPVLKENVAALTLVYHHRNDFED